MEILYAILLGVIQGLSEFLPISSTAHLTLAGKALGLIDPLRPELWTEYIAVIQLGTLVAVVVYFWQDIVKMFSGVLNDMRTGVLFKGLSACSADTRLAMMVVIGTIPVGLIGFTMKNIIEGTFTKSLSVIATSLIALALLMWIAEKAAKHLRGIQQLRWLDAFLIGCAQALALIPGSSRSGTTLTTGLFLGLERAAAARFSFLLSIPAVLASGLYEMSKIRREVFTFGVGNLVVATIVSGLAGYFAIAWLLRYFMKNTTMVFVWYRLLLGVLLWSLLLAGYVNP